MYLAISIALAAVSVVLASPYAKPSCAIPDECFPLSSQSARTPALRQERKSPPIMSTVLLTSVEFVTSSPSSPPIVSKGQSSPVPPLSPSTASATSEYSSTQSASSIDLVSNPTLAPTSASEASLTAATPTQSATLESDTNPWASKRRIAGVAVSSVFGLILLAILIYTLFATSRGINVCDCFGGCCGRSDGDDEEKSRLPSRPSETCSHP